MRKFMMLIVAGLSAFPAMANVQSDLIMQIQDENRQLNDQVRELTGKVEQLGLEIRELQRQMKSQPAAPAPQASANIPPQPSQPNTAFQPTGFKNTPMASGRTGSELYNHAYGLMQEGQFHAAEQAFREFIQAHPNDSLFVNARFWLAEIYFVRGDFKTAASEFGQAYGAYQQHKSMAHGEQAKSKAPEIMLKLAMSLKNIGKGRDAKVTLAQLKKEFPWAPPSIREQASRLDSQLTG
ncbi:MAG: tetratricopeptide repeat protein [Alphaproteobacteria bacterium]